MAKIPDNVHAEDMRDSNLTRLAERRAKLTKLRGRIQYIQYINFSAFFILIIASIFILFMYKQQINLLPLLACYLIASLAMVPFTRTRRIEVEQDLQAIEFDIDLLQFDVSLRETRAEKVLRINDLQLRRYYSLNLNQNIWVFGLGIICIFLGLAVIGVTMYIIVVIQSDTDTKIITAVIGSIGSILSSYVAAIYLKMHAAAASHLGSFHSRLVETHQLLLGNLLASRIEDDQKRWETLSQLALNMAKISP